ncbi:TetR family transcriptional regulator [Longispora fulva]|uniref:AcrR family transcriptional regulator n=1 Tax=Longispora fulva TaxID=619741 RepID=A0A8J7KM09_9ACTN|nr:TetR family transcriptional regulator [Longispora fulva]MBG6138606.1 AcrR family transcriptional regulator [Longispora fulva]GIG62287.1 TetR family transcriptional regulator [Longispora fulva]
MEAPTGSRRTPAPEERQRDAERSRRHLLTAALEVFAAKGYAGARVQDIADRAGVNKRLINYYFGGKEGLYTALRSEWLRREAEFATPDLSISDLTTRYLHEVLTNPQAIRLVLWHGLADEDVAPPEPAEDLSDLYRRQELGELAADLDPASFMLAMMSMVMAPITLPHIVRQLFGVEPDSPEFEARYAEQLRRIVGMLGERR